MRALVKRRLAQAGLLKPASVIYHTLGRSLRLAAHIVTFANRRVVNRHFAAADGDPKLQIGCGSNLIDGWLNSDKYPVSSNVMYLDAARRFPFPDDTFAYVYSEHMIGSLSIRQAQTMLIECFRTLAPGGKIRVATLDIEFLIDLYENPNKSGLIQQYMEWFQVQTGMQCNGGIFILNNFAKLYGIEFIYDEPTLRDVMETAGFSHIIKRDMNESGDDALRNLENEMRMPDGFLRMESFILEGTKIA